MLLEKLLQEIKTKYNLNTEELEDLENMFLQYGLAMLLSRGEKKKMFRKLKERYDKKS